MWHSFSEFARKGRAKVSKSAVKLEKPSRHCRARLLASSVRDFKLTHLSFRLTLLQFSLFHFRPLEQIGTLEWWSVSLWWSNGNRLAILFLYSAGVPHISPSVAARGLDQRYFSWQLCHLQLHSIGVTQDRRRQHLHEEQQDSLNKLPYIIGMIKSRRFRWAVQLERVP
jgi:hypothetical protein